jgi:hypothetical protein
MTQRFAIILVLLVFSWHASARDLHVDPDHGNDTADGIAGPVQTIARAMSLATAGDTIHLARRAEPYHESILIREKSGEPGKPIIIDGHGATLTGCDPLRPADWQQESPGLYKSTILAKSLKGEDTAIQRWFFLFDGKQQLMGRTSKGAKAAWKKPEELVPGEWTFLPDSETFYIKVDPSRELAKAGIEIPYRAQGVSVRGQHNAHWIIRNLTVTHVYNDGYNLHTNLSDTRFENIAAYECGDDGFSAHEGCQCEVDGYRASGNSTGFTNGFTSEVKLRNAYLFDNHATEFMQMHDSKFDVANVLIETESMQPFVVRGNPEKNQICRGKLDNILVYFKGSRPRPFQIGNGAEVTATRLTTIGLTWQVEGAIELSQSVLVGGQSRCALDIKSDAIWKASRNVYGFQSFSYKDSPLTFEAFQKATGQDEGSRAVTISTDELSAIRSRKPVFEPVGAALLDAKIPLNRP